MSDQPAGPAPIAIIGMACIFPQAPDLKAYWNNILHGTDAVGDPPEAWDAQRYLDSGRIKTPFGGYLKDLFRFDPREFGIMPNSVDGGEPDQFLALKVARDALVDAGYAGADVDHQDTGIILGHSTYLHRGQVTVIQNNIVLDQTIELFKAAMPDLDESALAQVREMLRRKLPPTNADTAPGLVPNVMTGRIANRLNFKGPNYLVDAACSSSLLAVGAAMDELRAGRSKLMLAGGVNASLPADVSTIFTQLGALSARGKVRPFESGSDGTLLGEGLGVVVLKRLDDAMADGDRIYAVLRGVGQASDGRGTGLLAPSVDGESLSIRRAYEGCGVDPSTVGLIEAHGTGIALGDRTEIAALRSVFGARDGEQGTVAIGSVKSMISHCIPAAGIAGLIKASLALHHKVLPPTLCEEVNPELGIEQTVLYVNTQVAPWIGLPGQPRRAGVDSFGFGGINTHGVVEQAPAQATRPGDLTAWPFELCVISGATVADLQQRLHDLREGLSARPDLPLDGIAAALLAQDRGQPVRLALVVKSTAALLKGLDAAIDRLGKDTATRWSTRAGVHFSAEPRDGALAFLFPGEGSQYTAMMSDLALCFDEVGEWLDFWRGLYPAKPGQSRTDIAFPPSTGITAEHRKALDARLHDMDVGSEAVMVGGQIFYSLMQAFEVVPDAMLGHSTGESSAIAASGALSREHEHLGGFVRELNAVYQDVLAQGHIATGALLAVGALPWSNVEEVLAREGQGVVVAMDNCANQVVLYGDKADIERVQKALTAIGGICMPLPFDRGYHTPAFKAVTEAFHGYYKRVKLGVPKVPLYSCASTERFPATPAAVRKLAAAQWSETVRFRETVLRMHDDGVRTFVELGPSANLTAFIGDILSEREHLALASNQRRRHGLEQWLGTLAQLWVGGRPMSLARLFNRRRIDPVDLNAPPALRRGGMTLDNTLPAIRLTDADRELIRSLSARPAASYPAAAEPLRPTELPAVAADTSAAPAPGGAETLPPATPSVETPAAPVSTSPPVPTPQAPIVAKSVDPASEVMAGYFGLMRDFLGHQQAVIGAAAPQAEVASAVSSADAQDLVSGAAPLSLPLLDEIVSQDVARLHARSRLSVHRDAFLRDHVLSGRVSVTDPELVGLACVPLMVSLEIMAEAAVALVGHAGLHQIVDVRAFDWIALDLGELTLDVIAEADPVDPSAVRVHLSDAGSPRVSAVYRFAPAADSLPALAPLPSRRPPRWDGQTIYDIGMFHGPVFQSLKHIEGWEPGGIDAQLSPCSLTGFFEPDQAAGLVLNPVLLDAVGQLAACWTAEYAGTDFNCFPSTIERIDLLAACPSDLPDFHLSGRQQAVGRAAEDDMAATRRWDFECHGAGGQPLFRLKGLVNVFFHVPNRFYQARRDPLGGWLGRPLALPGLPDARLWELPMLEPAFCAQSSSIFLRMLAHASLSFEEREDWLALEGTVHAKRQWLLGRLCLKEAVRAWVHDVTGEWLYPSDVVVLHDELGAPFVDGWWAETLVAPPAVSLSHTGDLCVAALAAPGTAVGIDVEDPGRIRDPQSFAATLAPAEQAWVAGLPESARRSALVRIWAAKEAASKQLGTGLGGVPEHFVVTLSADNDQHAVVHHNGASIGVILAEHGHHVLALAGEWQLT